MRVFRCFAFVDMCGFTRMNDTLGDEEAVEVLAAFRALVRRLAPEHGMIDLTAQLESADIVLPLRTGIAAGQVILFEGDDFIGMAINLASRLCDAAASGEILATADVASAVADEFGAVPLGVRSIPGIVQPVEVWRIPLPEREEELPLSFVE
jgi:adenylate cyclase